jgi:hypothetical protein
LWSGSRRVRGACNERSSLRRLGLEPMPVGSGPILKAGPRTFGMSNQIAPVTQI